MSASDLMQADLDAGEVEFDVVPVEGLERVQLGGSRRPRTPSGRSRSGRRSDLLAPGDAPAHLEGFEAESRTTRLDGARSSRPTSTGLVSDLTIELTSPRSGTSRPRPDLEVSPLLGDVDSFARHRTPTPTATRSKRPRLGGGRSGAPAGRGGRDRALVTPVAQSEEVSAEDRAHGARGPGAGRPRRSRGPPGPRRGAARHGRARARRRGARPGALPVRGTRGLGPAPNDVARGTGAARAVRHPVLPEDGRARLPRRAPGPRDRRLPRARRRAGAGRARWRRRWRYTGGWPSTSRTTPRARAAIDAAGATRPRRRRRSSAPSPPPAAPAAESFVDLGAMVLDGDGGGEAEGHPDAGAGRGADRRRGARLRGDAQAVQARASTKTWTPKTTSRTTTWASRSRRWACSTRRSPSSRRRCGRPTRGCARRRRWVRRSSTRGSSRSPRPILRRAVDGLSGQDDEKIGLLYWLGRALEAEGRAPRGPAVLPPRPGGGHPLHGPGANGSAPSRRADAMTQAGAGHARGHPGARPRPAGARCGTSSGASSRRTSA